MPSSNAKGDIVGPLKTAESVVIGNGAVAVFRSINPHPTSGDIDAAPLQRHFVGDATARLSLRAPNAEPC